jgi:hypothetical protein
MSKKMCPALPKKLCPSQVAEAAIGIEKTCEGKQAALSRLMVELQKDVSKGRFTPDRAAKVVMAKARGVEGTCRLQKANFDKAEIKRKAAEIAREQAEVNRFNGLGRARGPRRGSSSGLFGLGLFGL